MRRRLQHIRWIVRYTPTFDSEVRVLETLTRDEVVEHLSCTHIRMEIGEERTRPGQECLMSSQCDLLGNGG